MLHFHSQEALHEEACRSEEGQVSEEGCWVKAQGLEAKDCEEGSQEGTQILLIRLKSLLYGNDSQSHNDSHPIVMSQTVAKKPKAAPAATA